MVSIGRATRTTGITVLEVVGVLTDHDIGAETSLGLVFRGQRLLEGELDRVQVEITCCGRVTAETAVDDGLIAGAGEVVAVTGVDVSAEFHTLLGGLNEVVLNHLLRVLGGSFRTAVREGQRGHGRENAEDRCDLFDHVFCISFVVFVCVPQAP